MNNPILSIVIPNRNSPFVTKTIRDILNKAMLDIEIILNIDELWPEELVNDPRVTYIHPSFPIGLREGVNNCVRLAKGRFIMKSDDHCLFAEGFDKALILAHEEDNWVQIPRRYALDPVNWQIEERSDNKYPIDYMYIDFPRKGKDHDDGIHGVEWRQRRDKRDPDQKWESEGKILTIKNPQYIDETPSMQGSCYFMTKEYFTQTLGGLSEKGYGQFAQESQEIGFKTWLGGGKLMVNKKTWYAHLHKGKTYGRFYKMPSGTIEASNWSAKHWLNNEEPLMKYKFEWFINEKFPNMPSWPKDWQEQIRSMGWIK